MSQKEAEKRIKKNGKNELPRGRVIGKFEVFLNQFKNPLIYILLVAGSISFVLRDYIDAGVIFCSVILNTVIGFFQEAKANDSLAKLKQLIRHSAVVLRDGQEQKIDSSNLVVGDIIFIKAGNKIPTDARLIEVNNLMIDESPLTGESLPVEKNVLLQKTGMILADRKNMIYAGTTAVKGSGVAVVCGVGQDMEIGKIAKMVSDTKEEKTPLQKKLDKFAKILSVVIVGISLLIAGVGILQGRGVFEMFIVGVAVAVSAIPEGLLVAVTVILVLGMQTILKQKALVRKLIAAETLGSTTVICSDKTGTLTEGKMHVVHIVIGEKEFELKTFGSRQEQEEAKIVSLALQTAMMCNAAIIENKDDISSDWRIIGDPTDSALLSAALQSGLDKDKLLELEPKIAELPFESANKYMITLHKKNDGGFKIYEKGAAEKILAKASSFYHLGKINKLSDKEKKKLTKIYENFNSHGFRVIAVAVKELKDLGKYGLEEKSESWQISNNDWQKIDKDLVFVGFIALKDPLRKEAKETIRICRQAGIRPVVITGDHFLTARAIAKEVGLDVKEENIISGDELDKTSDEELIHLVKKIDLYARVSPHHKLRIVRALQARGEVVAMTGDGINDSPALKAADIGISLGTGTDIAKESSDIVLLDNNFKTIVSSVLQGRIIFANIRKVATYLLSDSFSEMIMIVGSIIFGTPLAILPAQILWINIINDGLPNFSLAFEKGDDQVMKDKPIKKNESILNKEMKILIFGVGLVRDSFIFGLFFYLFKTGMDIDYLRGLLFAVLGVKSLLAIFSLRSLQKHIWQINPFSNSYLLFSVAASFIFMILAIYLPFMQGIMSTTSLSLNDWLIVFLTAIGGVVITEAVKHYFIVRAEKN